jgi:UDP-glucuronate decarboxylase
MPTPLVPDHPPSPARAAPTTENLVLVAGGAGFIGSHLCDRLLERGHDVLALDDLSSGDRRNLQHLQGVPRFRFKRHDVMLQAPAPSGVARHIYNLACPASPAHYQSDPVRTTLTNVFGAWRLLELARGSGARVLQASTSEVYGDPDVHPQPESYHGNVNPIGPRSCYDEGKRCAEALCFAYRRQHRVDIRVARIFNTYGPRLRAGDGRVVSNFIVQALRGEPLTLYGDGQQTRSFCYVDDTVEGLLRLMDGELEGPLNIGNPVEHTILQLAERVLRLTGSRSRLMRLPMPTDDPQRRRPDIRRARHALGWEPQVMLDEGLGATIDWFRHELNLGPLVSLGSPPGRASMLASPTP